jgi:mRNA interferase RelE/StbE
MEWLEGCDERPNEEMKLTRPAQIAASQLTSGGSNSPSGSASALPAHTRSEVRDRIERHLRYGPRKLSKSRIKRLRGLERLQYRLSVGETKVFSDVTEAAVQTLAIVSKDQAQEWLDQQGVPTLPGGPGESEG